ncbi:MAG: SprT family zinc-dependent metalloprotease [Pseudomonadales bacterium]
MSNIRTTTLERGVFSYGDEVIHYDIIRKTLEKAPKTAPVAARKVVIKVHPDQRVVVTVPHDATNKAVQEAVAKRSRWIWKNITSFASQHDYVLPRKYVSGESQFYLGRRYVLKVLIDTDAVPHVKLYRGKLVVTLNNDPEDREKYVRAHLDKWYLYRANIIFRERLQAMLEKTTWVKGIPSFRIMVMKKQWGSCSKKGTLMLNPHLVKASKESIDYVILHELCHIAEHNHGDRFWRLLTKVMPNWKEVKAKLDDMAELYLND